jgi:hypothetical protein
MSRKMRPTIVILISTSIANVMRTYIMENNVYSDHHGSWRVYMDEPLVVYISNIIHSFDDIGYYVNRHGSV